MRVVVTGALGFVGINIARDLAAGGHEVIGVDIRPPDELDAAYLADVSDRVTTVMGDLADDDWTSGLNTRPIDAVVHAAAITPLASAETRQAVLAARINVAGTARVLCWAAATGSRRIVHISTGSVYGPVAGDDPVDEDVDQHPDGVYGITKSAGERLARRMADLYGLDLAIARLSHVYGPMERPSAAREVVSPVERWTRALILGEPIEQPRPDVTRDFVHVADVARAIRGLLEHGESGAAAYNVSSGVLTSETDLVTRLRAIEPGLETGGVGEPGASSPHRPPLAIDRIADAIGWQPAISLDDGLRAYVNWRRVNERLALEGPGDA